MQTAKARPFAWDGSAASSALASAPADTPASSLVAWDLTADPVGQSRRQQNLHGDTPASSCKAQQYARSCRGQRKTRRRDFGHLGDYVGLKCVRARVCCLAFVSWLLVLLCFALLWAVRGCGCFSESVQTNKSSSPKQCLRSFISAANSLSSHRAFFSLSLSPWLYLWANNNPVHAEASCPESQLCVCVINLTCSALLWMDLGLDFRCVFWGEKRQGDRPWRENDGTVDNARVVRLSTISLSLRLYPAATASGDRKMIAKASNVFLPAGRLVYRWLVYTKRFLAR